MSAFPPPQAVLFDLDGTLLDTAPDMGGALNELRAERGLGALEAAVIRPHVSHGAAALLRLGFGTPPEAELERLRERFLVLYRARIARETRLFAGGEHVLAEIERRNLPWGVVTNKPGWLTVPLLEALGLRARAACIVSGDTLPERKPHPRPLLHAAAELARAAERCIYVGDAERDMLAAHAAGMVGLVARFGYIGPADDPLSWPSQGSLAGPADLLGWLDTGDPLVS